MVLFDVLKPQTVNRVKSTESPNRVDSNRLGPMRLFAHSNPYFHYQMFSVFRMKAVMIKALIR